MTKPRNKIKLRPDFDGDFPAGQCFNMERGFLADFWAVAAQLGNIALRHTCSFRKLSLG